MKKILFVLLIYAIGCSESDSIIDVSRDQVSITYNSSNDNFVQKEIKYSNFIGEWKLMNTKYRYALGVLEHIENNYGLIEKEKRMLLGETGYEKICFWHKPEYVLGDIGYNNNEYIKTFTWTPASGAPAFTVSVNYENGLLTLYYQSVLYINNKYYDGSVYEIYQKK